MSEPTTLVTDYLLGTLSLVLARRLRRSRYPASTARQLWAASFLALAVAAFVGGTWHGLGPGGPPSLRRDLWSITYTAIGLTDLLFLAGAAWTLLSRGPKAVALALLMGRFAVYAAFILKQRDFRYVAYDYGGTLFLLVAFGLDLKRRRGRAAGFVLGGALVSFAGGLVQALRLDLHPQFNSNDLFHVIQMGGIWLFFRAGLLLRDRRAQDETLLEVAVAEPSVCGLVVATLAALVAAGCAPVFSELQSAKRLGRHHVEAMPSGPKLAIVKDRLALALPIGFAFGNDFDSGHSAQVHATLIGAVPAARTVELNGSVKYLIPLSQKGGDKLVALNLGLGLGPERWKVRPEVGFLLNPGEKGYFTQFSLGFSLFTGR